MLRSYTANKNIEHQKFERLDLGGEEWGQENLKRFFINLDNLFLFIIIIESRYQLRNFDSLTLYLKGEVDRFIIIILSSG